MSEEAAQLRAENQRLREKIEQYKRDAEHCNVQYSRMADALGIPAYSAVENIIERAREIYEKTLAAEAEPAGEDVPEEGKLAIEALYGVADEGLSRLEPSREAHERRELAKANRDIAMRSLAADQRRESKRRRVRRQKQRDRGRR